MTDRKTRRTFSHEFKQEAVALVTEQGYSYLKAAEALSIDEGYLRRWKKDIDSKANPNNLSQSEHDELKRLRREVKQLKMEKEILKKASAFFAREMS